MNLKELKELIELVSEKGFAEFEVERQGFRLRIARFNQPSTQAGSSAPPPTTAPVHTERYASTQAGEGARPGSSVPPQSQPPVEEEAVEPEADLHMIKSPMPGTFYRASSPSAEPFVKVGDQVEIDSVVCIIEAMKLMNNIESDVSGEVVKIYVENGQPVEYGQPLFGIRT